jgi:quercetin dioxygenase-like cupin family protein
LKEGVKKPPKVKVIHPEDMPWEDSPQGKLKHMINERMDDVQTILDLYMQELAPGGKSGKHHHMAEECLYILEGKGYDLHWDMDFELKDKYYFTPQSEPKRFEWEAGDVVLIPVNTVHQHFNADPEKPARFISAISCLYRRLMMSNLEQVE